jgi:glycosyltransferase involved in cell wall biosynthesis
MKIVQLLPELNEGGVERGVVELSRELVKLGHTSIVISNGGKLVDTLLSEGATHIKLDVCSKNPLTAYSRVKKLQKTLKELNPDIIHARSRVPAWLVYLANKSLHLPFVTTVHGFNSVSFYSEIMTKGDRVICVSSAIKEYIIKHYHTDEDKITIIPRGIDLDRFNPNNLDNKFINDFVSTHNLQDAFVITTVGRITQLKDLQTFIESISNLKSTHPDIKALIVGGIREDKQEYYQSLVELVSKLGLDDEVVFVGSSDKVAEIYHISDVVVSSSKKPESFGRSVAEALALNTPVVATNHGGVLDIIDEGVNGYFYEVSNPNALALAIQKANSLKFDGYNYITQNFSLSQMVDKTLGVYSDLV